MSRPTKQLHIFRRLTAVLCALLLCAAWAAPTVSAAPLGHGSIGGEITWVLEGGTLSIRGSGALPAYTEFDQAPWYPHRDRILRLNVDSGITAVGDMAFYDCSAMVMVRLPYTVKTVGDMAFAGCESLTTVLMPRVTTLGEYAFSRCFKLRSVTLPSTLTTVGAYAFYRCESLTYVRVPSSVTSLGGSAFAYCTGLLRADIDAAIDALPEWCFYGCESLQAVTLSSAVKAAGEDAFTRCDGLDVVYHSGDDATQEELSRDIAQSLPGFTVSQMGASDQTPPSVGNTVLETEEDCIQEITTQVTQKGDTIIEVEQTVTYPVTEDLQTGAPESFSGEIQTTISSPEGWDDVIDALREQGSYKITFESIYGEQKPIKAQVILNQNMPLTGDWLAELAGQDAVVTIVTSNGNRWSIDGNHILGCDFEDSYELSYTLSPAADLTDRYLTVVGTAPCWWLTFNTSINFPIMVELFLDPYAAHGNATLYERVPDDSLLRLQTSMIDTAGMVSFRLGVINQSTRYLLAMKAPDITTGEIQRPDSMGDVSNLVDPMDMYADADVRGMLGMTIAEFTRLVLIVCGCFFGVVLLVVLIIVIRSKRRAKIEAIRAEVFSADYKSEFAPDEDTSEDTPTKKRAIKLPTLGKKASKKEEE